MSFDKPTRNLLAKMVAACRKRLADDVASQLQSTYGLYPDGTVLDVARTADERQAAADLLALWEHLEKAEAGNAKTQQQNAYQRLVREIGFTLLNRLAALRLAEERGLLIECVRRGLESDGFQLFDQMANGSLGSRYATYRVFLDTIYAELALDLGALFDRSDPRGLLFPSEAALADLLAEFNHPDLAARALWQQDETIGWIYQYYNDPAERKQMRDASQAPRNSRELAVRNQFFTPRYVVEFLTDNTLGRIWYEMTVGRTQLAAQCRYLVRRPMEIFLSAEYVDLAAPDDRPIMEAVLRGDYATLPTEAEWGLVSVLALLIDGYALAPKLGLGECGDFANARMAEYRTSGQWRGNSSELWLCLFFEQRRWRHVGDVPTGAAWDDIHALYLTWRAALLAEQEAVGASQEELLHQPVYIAPRAVKDPRTLTMLDPACGSMHFGLYAFDLYETIYAEAWELEESYGARALWRPASLAPLGECYPDKTAFLRDIPRLIIEHNIHGIDIDPRAVQIANLSLWLRAQRSWQAQGVPAAERPRIRRSNVVTAEPMPGDRTLLDEFVATLHPPVLGDLVRVVFDKMQLAGEAGSLLKIETELSDAIAQAKTQWEASAQPQQAALLPDAAPAPRPRQGELFDVSAIDDAAFWERAEGLVLEALARYAGQHDLRHRLFAGDAARGFAFIDVCRKRYDVVLMNPPFGVRIESCNSIFESMYGDGRRDLYHYFYLRATEFTQRYGLIGAITPRTLLYQSSYIGLRESWLNREITPIALAELDLGVLDSATVRPVLVVLFHGAADKPVFYKNLKHSELPSEDLLTSAREIVSGSPSGSYTLHYLSMFGTMPSLRFSLWSSQRIVKAFNTELTLEPAMGKVTEGLTNEDDMRFLRCWWEPVPHDLSDRWWPFGKFDSRSTFMPDFSIVIDWGYSSYQLLGERGNRRANENLYFQPGIAFTRSCEVGMAATSLPRGMVFSGVSRYFLPSEPNWLGLLAYLNTRLVEGLHLVLTPDRDRITGTLRKIPLVIPLSTLVPLEQLSIRLWQKKAEWLRDRDETHRGFGASRSTEPRQTKHVFDQLMNEVFAFEETIEHKVRSSSILNSSDLAILDKETSVRVGARDLVVANPDLATALGASGQLLSVALGLSFGRWDIRYATGARPAPPLPDPFAPLPTCPPGMLQNSEGLPAAPADVPADYPLRIAWDGILVDDPGLGEDAEPHDADIVRRVREALAVLWPQTHDAIEAEACAILGVRELCDYLRKPGGFFADHLKRYSKSRRQAPIYWPLSTASGRYTVWLYYHRLNGETLYTVVNRYVEPKIAAVERALAAAEAGMGQSTGGAAVKLREQADDLRAFRAELDAFRGELLRVAGLPYRPNLNDGVLLNAAPLHRLFGLRKWAKDTEAAWRKLEAGEYDWAHIAYTIWPERVKEACRRDRSIAIAHGLEALCEVEVKPTDRRKQRAAKAPDLDYPDEAEQDDE